MARRGMLFVLAVLLVLPSLSTAQTTAGIGTTIVIPVTAQTGSFVSEVTVFNPGPSLVTASVKFYEANNASAPGPKTCNDLTVSANRSVQFHLATQCALGTSGGSQFGLLVLADKAVPATHAFYAFSRVQNPQGIGFSVEGFPVQDFNNQVSHATGLKKQAAAPTYQTNCFVGSLDQAVSYELRLFNDATGAQIGGTLVGSLQAFQQFRYLDVFNGKDGVNAPPVDQTNVRAQFTQTSGGSANLIGFCTVQDNTSFGADFRIAKSFGSPSVSFFAQGGNTFGTTATLGTLDNQPMNIVVNGQSVMRYQPDSSPNIIGGHSNNSVAAGSGQTIGGGGVAGTDCFEPSTRQDTRLCGNHTGREFATVSGGYANQAGGLSSTVIGGDSNTASGQNSTVLGGTGNVASGFLGVAMGHNAVAGFDMSFIWNGWSSGLQSGTFRENYAQFMADHGLAVDYGVRRLDGGGSLWVCICDVFPDQAIATSTGAFLGITDGMWHNKSDRASKTAFETIDSRAILDKVAALPIGSFQFIDDPAHARHIGPTAQDFHSTFSLGTSETSIGTGDSEGVALAAIQGLHQLVHERDARIGLLESRIQAQQQALDELRQTVKAMQSRISAGM